LEYRLLELKGKEIIRNQNDKEESSKEIENTDNYIHLLSLITTHKWHVKVTLERRNI